MYIIPKRIHSVPENQKAWYINQEQINIVGFSNLYAPGPVSHSWWYSGLINIGNQNTITLNASDYGLGEHIFRIHCNRHFRNTENIILQSTYITRYLGITTHTRARPESNFIVQRLHIQPNYQWRVKPLRD